MRGAASSIREAPCASSALACVLLLCAAPARAQGVRPPAFDALAAEATTWLQEYLRVRTVNPPGNETEGAKFLQALLAREGIPVRNLRDVAGAGQRLRPVAGHRRPAPARAPEPHRRGAGRLRAVALPTVRRRDRRRRPLGPRRAGHQGAGDRPGRDDGGAEAAGRRALAGPHPRGQSGRGTRVERGALVQHAQGGAARERGVPAQRRGRERHGDGRPDRLLRAGRHGEGAVLGPADSPRGAWATAAARPRAMPPCGSPGCWAASRTGKPRWC